MPRKKNPNGEKPRVRTIASGPEEVNDVSDANAKSASWMVVLYLQSVFDLSRYCILLAKACSRSSQKFMAISTIWILLCATTIFLLLPRSSLTTIPRTKHIGFQKKENISSNWLDKICLPTNKDYSSIIIRRIRDLWLSFVRMALSLSVLPRWKALP